MLVYVRLKSFAMNVQLNVVARCHKCLLDRDGPPQSILRQCAPSDSCVAYHSSAVNIHDTAIGQTHIEKPMHTLRKQCACYVAVHVCYIWTGIFTLLLLFATQRGHSQRSNCW